MASRYTARQVQIWNRKLHSYVGLYLLTFIWLFAVSGIILNHPTWEFAQFWSSREESSYEVEIRVPSPGDGMAQARDLMAQTGLSGEIERIHLRTDTERPGLEVRVLKPGIITDIDADFGSGRARIAQIRTNAWGVLHWLHHFTGVRMDRPQMQRDWVMTRLWSLAMDAVCLGLIFLVVSSLYLWYPQVSKRKLGWVCFGAGLFVCGFFVFGLSWIF